MLILGTSAYFGLLLVISLVLSRHRPERQREGIDSDLIKILHICLDSQELKYDQDMELQDLQPRG